MTAKKVRGLSQNLSEINTHQKMKNKSVDIVVDSTEKTGLTSSMDQEILAVNYALDSFRLFLSNKKEILVRTDCEAIVKFFNNKNNKRISQRRWLAFKDRILTSNYKVMFEHIKEKDNSLADSLSRCLFLK